MGSMVFQLPANVPAEFEADLERACIAGGQDGMPFPTHVSVEPGLLFVERAISESGYLSVPWDVQGVGRLMLNSATLMERRSPYDLVLELGRGKIHQLRNQTCEWVGGGLILPDDVNRLIQSATHAFGKAASHTEGDVALSSDVLRSGHDAARRLVENYIEQVFQVRHLRQPKLDTQWSCTLTAIPADDKPLLETFSTVSLPIAWSDVQPGAGDAWNWDEFDRRVAWAKERFANLVGGPLIDFSGHGLPCWLWDRELSLQETFDRLHEFVDSAVRRYQGTIRHWRLTSASNWSGVLASSDEELIWLVVRLVEAVRRIDPHLSVSVGLCQPWGDYLARHEHTVTPFGFADTLLRTGARIDHLELEMIMGVSPRGSYCRDMLDVSRLLDLYVLLGVPLSVVLGYPSANRPPDAQGNGDLRPDAGHWGSGYTPADQADWVRTFGRLALCKPYVQSITWAHYDDRDPHIFPYCGVIDSAGKPKPALETLRELRGLHLK